MGKWNVILECKSSLRRIVGFLTSICLVVNNSVDLRVLARSLSYVFGGKAILILIASLQSFRQLGTCKVIGLKYSCKVTVGVSNILDDL